MEEKNFSSIRTQIGILRGRGVIIKNRRFAKKVLLDTNYYNLINGYKNLFLDTNSSAEHFLHGTCFEELYALSEFDRKLRILTLEYILIIEKSIKTKTAYCFSKKHGHTIYAIKILNVIMLLHLSKQHLYSKVYMGKFIQTLIKRIPFHIMCMTKNTFLFGYW